MSQELALVLNKPVPRYTSYPTAPHFHAGVDRRKYEAWLAEMPGDSRVSLYLHLPFCDRLCWFCGCHTKQINRYSPITVYLDALEREISRVGEIIGERPVTALHWGGGSPSLLAPHDIARTTEMLRRAFRLSEEPEFSVELDPNDMTDDRYRAWGDAGLSRASIGVQDFDPTVQAAINRIQTFEQTRHVVEGVRSVGVSSLNIDMLYGLPHQTIAGAAETARLVASLRPERVALFGYAHVPWMKKHQNLIAAETLPDSLARARQSEAAAAELVRSGYERVGFDHFALPHDSLAIANRTRNLHRNFQGYTADSHDALVGLGASAISRLPQGYVQNVVATHEYQRRAMAGEGLVARGFELNPDDSVRGYAIERLLCDFELDLVDLRARFGEGADAVIDDAVGMAMNDRFDLVRMVPGKLVVTEIGRPYVRTVAAGLDAYLDVGGARYSKAV